MKTTSSLLIFIFFLLTISCNDDPTPLLTDESLSTNNEKKLNRNIDDVKNLIDLYLTSSSINTKHTLNYEIEVLTNNKLDQTSTEITDTLLYAVKDYKSKQTIIVSANKNSEPILAILDNNDIFSFDSLNNQSESIYLPFILNAVEYNNNSTNFNKSTRSSVSKQIIKEVSPKLKVEWAQTSDPFNRYTPNKYPAGCVPIAIA